MHRVGSPGVSEPEPVLLVESRDRVRIVRLNRPEALNAANPELHRRLAEVWVELEEDRGCAAVVVTGNGRAFCGGGDMNLLKLMNEDEGVRREILREARQIVERLIRFPFPVIAAVNGPAVGLGCSIAGLSDVVLIEESAYLADPHVSVGLVAADGGALTWPSMTSLLRAKEYLFTGDRIPAREAVEYGLANRVVPDGSSLHEALSLAERISRQPAQALIDTKRALNKHLERSMHDILDFALAAESISSASAPHREIVDRFLEKADASPSQPSSPGPKAQ
jgi:enoyl-CoA hydratase